MRRQCYPAGPTPFVSASRKRFRSQICDKCGEAASSVRCNDNELSLCFDCDSEAHSAVEGHMRVVIEWFSSFPSAIELAVKWELELDLKVCRECGDRALFDGLGTLDAVFADFNVPCFVGAGRKSALVQQPEGLAIRESRLENAEGSDLSPMAPCRSSNGFGGRSEVDRRSVKQISFTSLLLANKSDCVGFEVAELTDC